MSKRTEILNQRISEYLTDLYTQKNKIEDMESENTKLKREISRQRALAKKIRQEKTIYLTEIEKLKNQLKGSSLQLEE